MLKTPEQMFMVFHHINWQSVKTLFYPVLPQAIHQLSHIPNQQNSRRKLMLSPQGKTGIH